MDLRKKRLKNSSKLLISFEIFFVLEINSTTSRSGVIAKSKEKSLKVEIESSKKRFRFIFLLLQNCELEKVESFKSNNS